MPRTQCEFIEELGPLPPDGDVLELGSTERPSAKVIARFTTLRSARST